MASKERSYNATNGVVTGYGAILSSYGYQYDECNNLTKLTCSVAGSTWSTVYTYDSDNRPSTTTLSSGKVLSNTFDALGRLQKRTLKHGNTTIHETTLTYVPGNETSKTTGLVATYGNGSDAAYSYTYDDNSNILSITQGTTSISYEYDEANRLIRENNSILNQTITYAYDYYGNILNKKIYAYTTIDTDLLPTLTPIDTIGYTYNSTDWTDQLVQYGNETISYDAMGNPLTYRGYTFGWRGKQLTTASNGTDTLSFEYNEDGLRQKKRVNGVDTNYFYNGSVLIGMQRGTSKFLFSYDASGNVVSVNYNGTEYYYLRNAQGDIVKIIDTAGEPVVIYTYDTWGKKVITTGALAGTLGLIQPFRYRGYVYDYETGFYYLQSRYYDPVTGRFISADVLLSTGQGVLGHNCYAYCLDNPVRFRDSLGREAEEGEQDEDDEWWKTLLFIALLGPVMVLGCSNSNEFGIETENRGNCYQYATSLPYSFLDRGLFFPGYTKGYSVDHRFSTAESLREAIQSDYNSAKRNLGHTYTVTICDADTELNGDNEWIIAYCYSNEDFHFLRYDKDKGWTHKKGWDDEPTNLDWENNLINHPSTAALGPYNQSTLIYLKITQTA